ncbi:MAG: alpha/beta hydrolase [Nocardia sp.]|nr:alpha/beta hydrolase [Nocardia sp.]
MTNSLTLPNVSLPLPVARKVVGPLFRVMLHSRLPWSVQRAAIEAASVLQAVPARTEVHKLRLGGRPAERVCAAGATGTGAVMYLHGGGYTVGSPITHRSLAGLLAHEIGCPIYVPDYRLAPEHPYPAALDDAEAVFLDLVATGVAPDRIAVSGDSAGGGLALALAQRLRDRHAMAPAALGLIAPWTDPNEIPDRERDLVVSTPWSRNCAAAYLGAGDPLDPGYAPLLGELTGLPRTYVQVDSGELLYTQCERLVAALREARVPVSFSVTDGLWHVSQLQASIVAPAAAAARELAEFITTALSAGQAAETG